jgi:hypothetical protein
VERANAIVGSPLTSLAAVKPAIFNCLFANSMLLSLTSNAKIDQVAFFLFIVILKRQLRQ